MLHSIIANKIIVIDRLERELNTYTFEEADEHKI